jgi:hypothetical protein
MCGGQILEIKARMRFEVLMAVMMIALLFWVVMPCGLRQTSILKTHTVSILVIDLQIHTESQPRATLRSQEYLQAITCIYRIN